MGKVRRWTEEEVHYLEENWGTLLIKGIANKLDRSISAVKQKAYKLGLGNYIESGDYITLHQLFSYLGRSGGDDYAKKHWLKKGFPLKHKRIVKQKIAIVVIDEFWKWAEQYRTIVNFSKLEENILGAEPQWVKDQRRADIEASRFKKTPWTKLEDSKLERMVKAYRYTYKEISRDLMRTESAIKRRLTDLKIKERPLRQENNSLWTDEQIKTLIELYYKGFSAEYISDILEVKSGLAVKAKIEFLLKSGDLKSRCNKKCS